MSRKRGFVLPTTLLVMTLLTIMLTAAFTMVSAEYRTTDNSIARARAYALAQAGLQTYYSLTRDVSTKTYDSVRLSLTGGYVDVVARRMRDSTPNSDALWMVRASAAASDAYQSGQVAAQRTITQLASNQIGFPVRAALFAANGLYLHHPGGGSGAVSQPTLNGTDQASCGTGTSITALVYPSGLLTSNSLPLTGHVNGATSALASGAAVVAASRIDWVSLTNGDVVADYTVPGSTPVWNANRIILVNGNYTLTGAQAGTTNPGRGILIVTGNLTLSDVVWYGTILVGGRLVAFNTRFEIWGNVYTGLNIALGQSVSAVGLDSLTRGNNNREIHWNWCQYTPAVASMTALVPLSNAWSNTWATY